VFKGHNKMRVFQEEIFGPVVSVTTFKTDEEALSIANDTLYGLGAGIWSRDANRCYRFGRAIQAGRVWTNCFHAYPAHAAFGGYKQSGIGRENHKMMLDHYQQTKNMLSATARRSSASSDRKRRRGAFRAADPLGGFDGEEGDRDVRSALQLLAEIVADHGPVLFHQSGGCCDGSSPMCYPAGDFLIGDNDLRLGEIGGAPFSVSR
jgi:delta 1-pyrroline-5-carboxylate dehydrogenase